MRVQAKVSGNRDPQDHPQLYFDGQCALCCAAVRFLIRHDRDRKLRYGSLQGQSGRQLLEARGLEPIPGSSLLLLDGGRLYSASDAVLRVCRFLDGAWPLAQGLRWIPRPLRDGIYRLVAHNRYRWFGRLESCWLPDPALEELFLK